MLAASSSRMSCSMHANTFAASRCSRCLQKQHAAIYASDIRDAYLVNFGVTHSADRLALPAQPVHSYQFFTFRRTESIAFTSGVPGVAGDCRLHDL